MSLTSSRELADSVSGLSEPGCEQSRSAKSTRSAGESSPNIGQASRSSTMCEPSPPIACERLAYSLTSSAADSPAKTLVSQGGALAWTELGAGFGQSSSDWFARYDLHSSSWRTRQACLVSEWEQFSETWPRSGTMRNGTVCQLADLVPPISGNGFGLLPTPTVGGGGQSLPEGTTPTGRTPDGCKQTVCLERYLAQIVNGTWPIPFLPTITVNDGGNITAPKSQFSRSTPGLPVRLAMTAGIRLGHASLRTFAEWMMGYEVGWTKLASSTSATPSSRKSRKSSGAQS